MDRIEAGIPVIQPAVATIPEPGLAGFTQVGIPVLTTTELLKALTAQNEALRRENELLRAENQYLGVRHHRITTFILGFVHDVKNDITAPDGLIQYLMRPGATIERVMEALPVISKGLRTAKTHLISLPDRLQKVDQLKQEPVDIIASLKTIAVECVVTERMLDASPDKLELNFDTSVDSQQILGDPEGINSVFTNLIINAIQAMRKSPVKQLSISCQANEGRLRIHIGDTGPGIPAGIKNKVFERGFTTKPEGNGNGLADVEEQIEAHLGRIQILKTDSTGTTFEILLPIS